MFCWGIKFFVGITGFCLLFCSDIGIFLYVLCVDIGFMFFIGIDIFWFFEMVMFLVFFDDVIIRFCRFWGRVWVGWDRFIMLDSLVYGCLVIFFFFLERD